jgi:hypothetical protein
MNKSEADNYGKIYADLLLYLKSNELDLKEMNSHFYLNEWFHSKSKNHG